MSNSTLSKNFGISDKDLFCFTYRSFKIRYEKKHFGVADHKSDLNFKKF